MSTKQAVHTFQGGMVKDLDKSIITSDKYLEARNVRPVTVSGESTGALENIEGNNNLYSAIYPGATLTVGNVYVVVKGTATYNGTSYTLGQQFTCVGGVTVFSGAGSLVIDANQLMPNNLYVAGSGYVRDTLILFLTSNTTASPGINNGKTG